MRNRNHKSTKIPGVKLRPTSGLRNEHQSSRSGLRGEYSGNGQGEEWDEQNSEGGDVEAEEEGDDDDDNGSQPLRGYNFCFTGIPHQKVSGGGPSEL